MAASTSRPTDDDPVMTTTSWVDPTWFSGKLHRATAVEYFQDSPFCERGCLNNQLKMQGATLYVDPRGVWRTPREKYEKLQKEPGIVYLREGESADDFAEDAQVFIEPLYVLKKVRRGTDGSEVLLRHYYILDGVVYEAPTLKAILRARLKKIAWHLSEAWSKAVVAPPTQPLQQSSAAAGEQGKEEAKDGASASRKRSRSW